MSLWIGAGGDYVFCIGPTEPDDRYWGYRDGWYDGPNHFYGFWFIEVSRQWYPREERRAREPWWRF